jgi:hypothetical protein
VNSRIIASRHVRQLRRSVRRRHGLARLLRQHHQGLGGFVDTVWVLRDSWRFALSGVGIHPSLAESASV